MSPQLIKRSEVEHLTSLSCSSIYAQMANGEFPRPKRTGARSVRWILSDVQAWIESRPETNSDKGAA